MNPSISASNVLAALFILAPQFYTTDPTILAGYNALYTLVACQINDQILACCGVMAYAFLMAAYLTLAAQPNEGVFSGLTEGQLSVSYNVSADMGFLLLNPYGRAYIDLINRTVVGSTVTNLPVVLGGIIQGMPVGCGCGQGFGQPFGNFGWSGCCGW